MTNWSADSILAFLNEVLGYLLAENILYPSISLSSVQAESKESALSIASKIKAVQAFRDGYNLY